MKMEQEQKCVTIHGDFVNAAELYKQNDAVWTEFGSITYQELDKRSSAFACWMLNNKLAPNKRTALILPKSIDTIVAILGTLKAGNTYVPLGDTWPANRLNAIVENGDFELVVMNREYKDVDLGNCKQLFTSSNEWSESQIYADLQALSMVQISPEDQAYILYTSGSTGIPKGVCVSHAAAQYFPEWAKKEFNVDSTHRIASIAPFTFDLSTFDLFTGLASGGCVYIVPEKYKMFPSRLSGFLEKHKITTLYAVPSTLTLLLLNGNLDKRDLSHLKAVLFAGEVFPIAMCRQFRKFLPVDAQYYNLYGPTETNVCTYYDASVVPEGDENLPIGLPLPGTTSFIDSGPDDEPGSGELCIFGPTLMSGYWGKPNKNALYWTTLPSDPTKQAYRTGDITYQDDKGNWIYKGRADKMVKIWGYRVELGEIESAILKYQGVELCAVVKRDKAKNLGEELVAFITRTETNAEKVLDHTDLFKHSKSYLPHYMVPSHIYELESFPVNNSGKVDRLSLEKTAQDYVTPN
ncbi:MAG: amino acid adenylation domain-containing protein [Kangiellaceae bacterium]|nr:amino acid adenylation domain-containing protein [Kangiellaceae bacterium]